MKKILFVALGATLLAAGCQKTEIIGLDNSQNGPAMTFTTGMSKLTKSQGEASAVNNGQENLEFQDFSVWAYAKPGDDFSTSTAPVVDGIYDGIKNLHVECTSPSAPAIQEDLANDIAGSPAVEASWSTEKEYYWPGEDKNLMFFAVSAPGEWLRPDEGDGPVSISITDEAVPTMIISDFVVDNLALKDLMVADYKIQNQDDKVVELTFRHTLSKVEFVFKTAAPQQGQSAPNVWVKSLELTNLKSKGDLTLTSNASATGTNWDFEWALEQNGTTFTDNYTGTVNFDSDVENLDDDNSAMLLSTEPTTFATWLMLPQELVASEVGNTNTDEANQVKVTYVINKRQFTSVFDLVGKGDNNTIEEWERNQHIKYTVTLAPNVISFKATAEEWTQHSGINSQN